MPPGSAPSLCSGHEIDVLARTLDPARLFIWATVDREDVAEDIVRYSQRAFRKGRSP